MKEYYIFSYLSEHINENTNKKVMIRQYQISDKNAVMDLIKRNTPAYFAEEEAADLSKYLDNEIELYYVVLFDNKIVGCGGINFAENKTIGKISWDIIHPDYQGKSLGSQLLAYRIDMLKSIDTIRKITVRTSQLVYQFYEKQGFVLKHTKKGYWTKGFDMYYMEYENLYPKLGASL